VRGAGGGGGGGTKQTNTHHYHNNNQHHTHTITHHTPSPPPPQADFPANRSLGIFEWWFDTEKQKGIVRVYQRVSPMYSWICTYFGADAGIGIKGNQAYALHPLALTTPALAPNYVQTFLIVCCW
jgi:hypothetical protein